MARRTGSADLPLHGGRVPPWLASRMSSLGSIITDDGKWTVVQQGMNGDRRQARRYHWHSQALTSFVEEPHSAIDGPVQGEIVNLTDRRAATSRSAQLELLGDLGPDRIVAELAALTGEAPAQGLL